MANIRDLRQSIHSVGNIQKITRAMEMVASTKLRRFQDRALQARPYSDRLEAMVRSLAAEVAANPEGAGEAGRLYLPGAADAPRAVLFVGSDRGLCGAYNSNAAKELDAHLRSVGDDFTLYVIGRKAMAHAARMGYPVAAYFEDLVLEKMDFAGAAAVTKVLTSDFLAGKTRSVAICSTRFRSLVRYEPALHAFLPIVPLEGGVAPSSLLLEPTRSAVLGRLIPRYLETRIFHLLLEALASEFASRRFAMKNATEAAGDMKRDLTRSYNRARQAKITSEITEIVSGAEAL